MLCYSAPTSFNNDFINDGVILDEHNKAVNLAVKVATDLIFWRGHTLRCILRRTEVDKGSSGMFGGFRLG